MSKTKRAKTLAEQIAELDNPQPLDYDPEAIDDHNGGSDDDLSDSSSLDNADGREHYAEVGKSALRKRDPLPLGPQYAGTRVRRDALENGNDSDVSLEGSEALQDGSDISGEELVGEEEVDGSLSGDSEDLSDSHSESEDDSMSDVDSVADAPPVLERDAGDTAKLRGLMNEQAKTVAASIHAANKADTEKGLAVKTQRRTFDSLLNTRIRLQKALIATNGLATGAQDEDSDMETFHETIKGAETAALTLLNNLTDYQDRISSSKTGTKRKRSATFTTATSSRSIWDTLKVHEDSHIASRDSVLNKWSQKSRPTNLSGPRLAGNQATQALSSVLKSQLGDSERLIARTHTPRSCAPGLTSSNPRIYDDADFYGILLKELLEQRTSNLEGQAPMHIDDNLSAQYRAAREAKTKRQVDTRASKGRKLRYTVHEKLQNFMAPDPRGDWNERQADELFSSLLGKRSHLDEDVAQNDEDDLEGLALF